MTGKIEAPFVFGVRVEGDTFTDRHEETERLKANFTYSPTEFTEFTETTGEEYSPTDFTDAHRWLGCVGLSHRIRRTHRNDWWGIFSHRIHGCSQIFRLRCCLLICEHLCNLWENILHHKLLWVLWLLWKNSLVGSPNLCTSVQSVGGSSPPETSVGRWFSGCVGMAGCHTLLIRYLWEFS